MWWEETSKKSCKTKQTSVCREAVVYIRVRRCEKSDEKWEAVGNSQKRKRGSATNSRLATAKWQLC